ncbi:MAG: DUF5606 domain-containing protein [Flavobacteriales bacterium]|jgi:hypothetical protein|nr:DUF5606 domain-containing protein [Flavobacteriales bacterium]
MALDKILSVSGKSGLYRLVGQMKNGIIVEGISDGKRFPVHGSAKVSALEEISIYTNEEQVPLNDVFKTIFEKQGGKVAPDHKSDNKEMKAYFETVLPDYDPDRVYVSDMAKVLKWYNALIENNAYDPADETVAEGEEKTEEPEAKKVAKKAKAKKAPKSAPKSAARTKTAGASAPRKAGGTQRGS